MLTSLVGKANVSSVSLESMSIERTFPLAAMDGKLANVVTEMSEINKSAEGVLKQLVSGDPINVEKKHRDPFVMNPTARLTFATNVLPRFNDRSDGLWRRMIILPFDVQIPVKEQDKRLASPEWWKNSGELPGILNWSIEGLRRLLARGYFEEPEASKVCKSELMADCNHARVFLETFCEPMKGKSVPTSYLYQKYYDWALSMDQEPVTKAKFSRQVRDLYPTVSASKHAKLYADGARSREWVGLHY